MRSHMMRQWWPVLAIVAVLVLSGGNVVAEPLGSIDAHIEGDKLTVGDPFWYVVLLTLPADSTPKLPGNEVEFPGFEVRDADQLEEDLGDGQKRITLRYELIGFAVGETEIADFEITAQRLEGDVEKTDKYKAPPVKVVINSVLPASGAQPKPIYGPFFMAEWWRRWVLPAVIALAVAGLIALVTWWIRRRKRDEGAEAERVLTPQEQAICGLEQLRNSKLIGAGEFKAFYSELSEVMRTWVEERAEICAMESTTAIIRWDLAKSDLPVDWQKSFIAILSRGDLVKFAKWEPADRIAYDDLDAVCELIRQQAIVEAVEEDDNGLAAEA